MDEASDNSEDVPIAVEFADADEAFRSSLEEALPDYDIVERSSFSGSEVLAVIGKAAKPFISALSALLLQTKKNAAQRSIKIKTGRDSFVELTGFGGDDLKSMAASIEKLIKAQKR